METDFITFFLLVENKSESEIRQNPILKNITARSLILLGETDILASFLHFSETLGGGGGFFSHLLEKYFLAGSFIPASGGGCSDCGGLRGTGLSFYGV